MARGIQVQCAAMAMQDAGFQYATVEEPSDASRGDDVDPHPVL